MADFIRNPSTETSGSLLADLPDIDLHYCSDPIEAISEATKIRPSVILQDLVMPSIDGLDLVKLFRANPATAETPIGKAASGGEKIVLNGDRFVLLDFWLPKWGLVVELDGFQHERQKRYDHQRSMWLARQHGMKVVRFFNAQVFSGAAEERIRQMLGLPSTACTP